MIRPYYTMRIDLAQCAGMYQLNGNMLELGIPMEIQMTAPVKVDLPVNHWIRGGKNELLMAVFPTEDPGFSADARCRMTLRVKDAHNGDQETYDIASIEFSGQRAGGGTGGEDNAGAARLSSSQGYAPQEQGDVVVEEARLESDPRGFAVVRRSITVPGLNIARWK